MHVKVYSVICMGEAIYPTLLWLSTPLQYAHPPCRPLRPLGVLQIDLGPLIDTFQPSFERCLEELTSLLPQLADEAYTAFIDKVGMNGFEPDTWTFPPFCCEYIPLC